MTSILGRPKIETDKKRKNVLSIALRDDEFNLVKTFCNENEEMGSKLGRKAILEYLSNRGYTLKVVEE